MNKWVFVVLALVCLAGSANAETVFERSLEEMGYGDFWVEGAEKADCLDILFAFPEEEDFGAEGNYPIASLSVERLPVKGKNFYIETALNDGNLEKHVSKSIECGESCWLRIHLAKSELKQGDNRLQACLYNSLDVTKSGILNESKVGIYKTADFSQEDAFVEIAERYEVELGETVRINLLLHNYGSVAATVEMIYARPLAEY